MSNSVLKKITIKHLRGSTAPFTLQFEKGKRLTVIYGENGCGKTTICDAFEFLGNGKVGSLDNRGLGQTQRYWHSVGKTASDVSVTLESNDSTCTGKMQKSEVVVVPDEHRPRVEVLRRSQILSLLEATPGARYMAISKFIDVSGIEASEANLRELIRTMEASRDVAIARIQENEAAVRNFWAEAGSPSQQFLDWARQEASRDTAVYQTGINSVRQLRTAFVRVMEHPQKMSFAVAPVHTAKQELEATTQTLEECLASVAQGAEELMALFEAAHSFLRKHPDFEHCPLCESTENASDLSHQVQLRIEQFESLRGAKIRKQVAERSYAEAQRGLTQIMEAPMRHSEAFERARRTIPPELAIPLPAQPCPCDSDALIYWTKENRHLLEQWDKTEAAFQDKTQFVATLKRVLKDYEANVAEQKEIDRVLPRFKKTLDIVREERRKFTDDILVSIASEVARLYEAVHPGEGLSTIQLELDPKKRASLTMGAQFGGQSGTPPQAYYSQSHLDTLGLCVFLALSAMDQPDETILALDDILTSVDEPHVDRLIEMLCAEATKFRHCIITTHYRPWKEKLRWGWLKTGQLHFVELTKWTLSDGVTTIRTLPDVTRLRELLNESPPDPQLICSKAGVILEAALNFLTEQYQCSVPRKPGGDYTLGDLLPNVKTNLRKALRVEVLDKDENGDPIYRTVALGPILDELARISQTRNIFGCHFNALSFSLLSSDAVLFGQQVVLLMDTLTDGENGWPKNKNSGSYWATSGETRRLHPLQKPS
jgi:energy-coupling factor transporter ATP-binding protein EcfA2